jgi:hypothetical protein
MLMDLHVLSPVECEKVVFGSRLPVSHSVCMCVCMYEVGLASAGTVGRIVFLFGIQEFINHRLVSDEF